MTEPPTTARCRWCGRGFDLEPGPGRPKEFCRQACRQRDYISRLRARDAGLAESELIITRTELESLRDKLYVLESAVADAQRDLEAGDDDRAVLQWVLEAAEPLFDTRLGESRPT